MNAATRGWRALIYTYCASTGIFAALFCLLATNKPSEWKGPMRPRMNRAEVLLLEAGVNGGKKKKPTPQTPPRAVIAGIVAGFAVWVWLLLLPVTMDARGVAPAWLPAGPFGIAGLSPDGFFGLTGWSRLGRAVGVSLFLGTAVTLLVMGWRGATPRRLDSRGFDAKTLRDAGRRFLPRERVEELLAEAPRSGRGGIN